MAQRSELHQYFDPKIMKYININNCLLCFVKQHVILLLIVCTVHNVNRLQICTYETNSQTKVTISVNALRYRDIFIENFCGIEKDTPEKVESAVTSTHRRLVKG